jgi:hypothetical protein
MWRAAVGDPYPMEKNPDEVPMFARFVERGLALPASDFFKGLRPLLRSLRGDQTPLDLVPEIFPYEAAAECQQPASSQRSWHSDV